MTDIESILKGAARARLAGADREAAAAAARAAADRAFGAGLAAVSYATLDSPLGGLLVARTQRGLVRISYAADEATLADLARRLSPRIVEAPAALDPIRRELDEYFAGRRTRFRSPVDWSLVAGFGRRVLRATAAIPFGQTASYRDVATRAGSPGAARAAGNALGRNPIPIVIPCHRILHSGGGLGGYTGGLDRKIALLELEGVLD